MHFKIAFFVLVLSFNVFAAETIVSEREVTLPVDISTTKIKLSRADYSSPVVKVLIPELAAETILNHRNTSEGAPCLATYETMNPQDVIQNRPSTEFFKFKITIKKHTYVTQNNECNVSLTEEIEGNIRGFNFYHDRSISLPSREVDDCK
jgi:hypothetical protein